MAYITDSFDEKIINLLGQGKVGVLPTDTIYGISTRALDERAVEKIHKLKDRRNNKPFIVLISQPAQLEELGISVSQFELVKKYWPGCLSVIFNAKNAQKWLQLGTESLAVRWPDHQALTDLINKTGPIISTSANLQGETPANSVAETQKIFGDKLDFYVDAGEFDAQPSTIAEISGGKLKVIRQGAVKIK